MTWSCSYEVCASRRTGHQIHAPLTPIPVSGPFDTIGIDVIKFPTSSKGNKYAIVMMDYLTKWPEVFPVKDQTSLTIARILVEQIVPRHGVPSELLSDRGAAFLSKLMEEVYLLQPYSRRYAGQESEEKWQGLGYATPICYRATPVETTGETPFLPTLW